ncbi:transmembrane amino acid transporter protein-domain-containing protein [Haematococcus lacustris]
MLRSTVVVEEDAAHRSVYGAQPDSLRRALYSAIVTLTLGVLGSTILPVPFAFSKLGVIPGCATMDQSNPGQSQLTDLTAEHVCIGGGTSLWVNLFAISCQDIGMEAVVAFVNDRTCLMLIRASNLTGRFGFEELAAWAGGRKARPLPQALPPSSIARILELRELGAGQGCDPGLEEAWWLQRMRVDGRPAMLLVVALVLFPLCLQRHIRQFEKAATVGVAVIVALMLLIASQAVQQGFPAITSGQVPIWFKPGSAAMLPEAFAVLGFAFYMQPMLMPLLAEMPRGEAGMKVSEQAVHITLYGVASAAYGSVGLFGAALFGDATESNIMVNDLLPGQPRATLVLYGALMVYLCCGMVTTHYALRASLEVLLCGEGAPYVRARSVAETVVILLAALAVACTFPSAAEKIFALTGCTAVCLVCYVIPVFVHLRLRKAVSLHRAEQTRRQRAALAVGKAVASRDPDCESGSARGEEALQQQQQDVDENEPLLVVLPATPSAGYSVQAAEPGFAVCATRPKCKRSCSDRETSAHTAIEQAVELALAEELAQLPLSTSWDASECLQHFPVVHSAAGQVLGQLLLPAVVIIVGVGCSAAGLWVAATDIYKHLIPNA